MDSARPLKSTNPAGCAVNFIAIGFCLFCLGCEVRPASPQTRPTGEHATEHFDVRPTDDAGTRGSAVTFAPPALLFSDAGMRVERQRWNFDGEHGWTWRVRLPRNSALDVVSANELTSLADLADSRPESFAAINGGFYRDTQLGYEPMGLVVANSETLAPLSEEGGSGVLIDDGNSVRITHRRDYPGDAQAAMQSIDRLVFGGKSLVRRRDDPQRAARSAVALTDDAVWLVLLAGDGSVDDADSSHVRLHHTGQFGVPLWAFALYLAEALDSEAALNLDGAVSSQLLVDTRDHRLRVEGERGILNSVVFAPQRGVKTAPANDRQGSCIGVPEKK